MLKWKWTIVIGFQLNWTTRFLHKLIILWHQIFSHNCNKLILFFISCFIKVKLFLTPSVSLIKSFNYQQYLIKFSSNFLLRFKLFFVCCNQFLYYFFVVLFLLFLFLLVLFSHIKIIFIEIELCSFV